MKLFFAHFSKSLDRGLFIIIICVKSFTGVSYAHVNGAVYNLFFSLYKVRIGEEEDVSLIKLRPHPLSINCHIFFLAFEIVFKK
jgi:hypothetical protein